MFGSDYPSIPYERLLPEWSEVRDSGESLEMIFHGNAERVLGLGLRISLPHPLYLLYALQRTRTR